MKPNTQHTIEFLNAASLAGDTKRLGAILIALGHMTWQDVTTVLDRQRESGGLFGRTAMDLHMIDEGQLLEAVGRQFKVLRFDTQSDAQAAELAAAWEPNARNAAALRRLRSELLYRGFGNDPAKKALTIASAVRGEGRSYLAANLAVMFVQAGKRTLLIDADMRNGRQHALFSLKNAVGLSTVLAERSGLEAIQPVGGGRHLSVLPCGPMPPAPEDLLARPAFDAFIHLVHDEFDIVLCDTPSFCLGMDSQAVASATAGVLLVVRQHHTPAAMLAELMDAIHTAHAPIVGTVLNKF